MMIAMINQSIVAPAPINPKPLTRFKLTPSIAPSIKKNPVIIGELEIAIPINVMYKNIPMNTRLSPNVSEGLEAKNIIPLPCITPSFNSSTTTLVFPKEKGTTQVKVPDEEVKESEHAVVFPRASFKVTFNKTTPTEELGIVNILSTSLDVELYPRVNVKSSSCVKSSGCIVVVTALRVIVQSSKFGF